MALRGRERVRWGILGCGDVTEVKSGPALMKAARSEVTAVMRRDWAKAADYARRHGVDRWRDDAAALIEDPTVDAVYIATPPDSHAAYALQAIAASKPVLLEKPMAPTLAECATVAEAARAADVSVTIAYYRRALPRFERVRRLLEEGAIGPVRWVEIRQSLPLEERTDTPWKLDPARGGGGQFADMQSHVLDWLGATFGAPGGVSATVRRDLSAAPVEDLVSYQIAFGETLAVGCCCYVAAFAEESLTLHGADGSVSMGGLWPTPITLRQRTCGGAPRVTVLDVPDPPHVHQPLVERVVAHLLDGAPNPCGPDEGMVASQLLERIYSGG